MEINLNETSVSRKTASKLKKPLLKRYKLKHNQKIFNKNVDKDSNKKTFKTIKSSKIEKAPQSKSKKALIVITIILIIVGGISYFSFGKIQTLAAKMGIELTANSVINTIVTKEHFELKKDKSGIYTNILAIGIDTRETSPGLQNTDTIMISSYNHKTNEIVMLSIPRDTYVDFANGTRKFNKINAVYNIAETREKGTGLESLKDVVESYLGIDIQYYGMMNYKAFTETIDILDGITVDVAHTFTDHQYPAEPNSTKTYQNVHFDAGLQVMDGETALKYARSRKSLDNGEGSDFARSKRQQIVVKAIKDKILSSDVWLHPNKILELLATLGDNIKMSETNLQDIKAGLALADKAKNAEIYSFVFDPTIGNGNVIYEDRVTWAIVPKLGVGNYEDTNLVTKQILENPTLYSENAIIWIYDIGLGYYPTFTRVQELQKQYPYLAIYFGGTLFYDKEGEYIYENPNVENAHAAFLELGKVLGVNESFGVTTEKPEFITGTPKGDVVILIGAEATKPVETEVVK